MLICVPPGTPIRLILDSPQLTSSDPANAALGSRDARRTAARVADRIGLVEEVRGQDERTRMLA